MQTPAESAPVADNPTESLYDIPFAKADGRRATLGDFAGQVLLAVNVASRCGLTPQYDGLVQLQARYRTQGFQVLGFPSNDFAGQEPGSDAEIQEFCRLTYGVDFPVFAKVPVKGEGAHPLYRRMIQEVPRALEREGNLRLHLAAKGLAGNPGDVLWNFEKFVISRFGKVVARFAPDVAPDDPMVARVIEFELLREREDWISQSK